MANETGTFIYVGDGDTYNAYAGEAITKGSFVWCSSSDDAVTGAGLSSYDTPDIIVWQMDAGNDYKLFCGVAMEAIAASGTGPILTHGLIICQGSASTAGAGQIGSIAANKNYTVEDVTVGTNDSYMIGTALTGASADDKYIVLRLNK